MSEGMTRMELDKLVCAVEGCDCGGETLFLTARCHPGAKMDVFYADGALFIACGVCAKLATRVAVATGGN